MENFNDFSLNAINIANKIRSWIAKKEKEQNSGIQPLHCEVEVRDIIGYCYSWRDSNDPVTDFQILTYRVLTESCFFNQIENSSLVAEVTTCVYSGRGRLASLFLPIFLRDFPEYNIDKRLSYYLRHACQARLEFGNKRVPDLLLGLPHEAAAVLLTSLSRHPNILLTILRYGPRLDQTIKPLHREYVMDTWTSDNVLLNQLLQSLLRVFWHDYFRRASLNSEMLKLWAECFTPSHDVDNYCRVEYILNIHGQTYIAQSRDCIRYLVRATGQLTLKSLDFIFSPLMTDDPDFLCINSRIFIRKLAAEGFLPWLPAYYFHPARLQHLCRYVIRSVLNANWQLPSGIYKLPLPTLLRYYLDLLED